MKPIVFPEVNVTYAKDQPEYQPLPAYKKDTVEGEVVTCWRLTRWERIKLLFTGRIWVSLMSFNRPLTPSYITTKKEEVVPKDAKKNNDV